MINFMRGSGGRGVLTPLSNFVSIYIKKNSQKYACPPPSKNLSNRRTPPPPLQNVLDPHMNLLWRLIFIFQFGVKLTRIQRDSEKLYGLKFPNLNHKSTIDIHVKYDFFDWVVKTWKAVLMIDCTKKNPVIWMCVDYLFV